MRRVLIALVLALVPLGAMAQTADPDPSELASIRAELVSLNGLMIALRQELEAQAAPATGTALTGPMVLRLDRLEAELRAVTGQVEQLQFRVGQIAEDGTRRISDLEFRLVELEGGDIGALGDTPLLGGEVPETPVAGLSAPTTAPAVSLAVSEQSDFDAAVENLKSGEVDQALEGFRKFLSDYPGGPLTAEAQFMVGEAETQRASHKEAARAYLGSFTAAPNGPFAARALMQVGVSLGALGQTLEACQTLDEVLLRYPGDEIQPELLSRKTALGCS